MAQNATDIGTENRQIRLAQVALIGFILALVLLAIGLPLGGRIKAARATGTATENMRVSGRALLMYAEDWGGIERGLPNGKVAQTMLDAKSTCDPEDTWRSTCSAPAVAPMIGSFAYVRGTKYFTIVTNWKADLAANANPTLLIDPFRSRDHISYFTGDEPPIGVGSDTLPLDMLRLRADGSISSKAKTVDTNWYPFKWPTAFWLSENTTRLPPALTGWTTSAPIAAAPPVKVKPKHRGVK